MIGSREVALDKGSDLFHSRVDLTTFGTLRGDRWPAHQNGTQHEHISGLRPIHLERSAETPSCLPEQHLYTPRPPRVQLPPDEGVYGRRPSRRSVWLHPVCCWVMDPSDLRGSASWTNLPMSRVCERGRMEPDGMHHRQNVRSITPETRASGTELSTVVPSARQSRETGC